MFQDYSHPRGQCPGGGINPPLTPSLASGPCLHAYYKSSTQLYTHYGYANTNEHKHYNIHKWLQVSTGQPSNEECAGLLQGNLDGLAFLLYDIYTNYQHIFINMQGAL